MMEDKRRSNLVKALRQRQTDAEIKLWHQLKNRQLEGAKFRRQHPIGKYIVDFVCLEKELVVEIDGGQHNERPQMTDDEQRTRWLETAGYHVIRYWNNDVLENIEGVTEDIREIVLRSSHPHLSPLPSRERI